MTEFNTLADRLTYATKLQGLSQRDLARMVGVSPAGASKWFTGKSKSIKSEYLNKIASVLQVSSYWLTDGQGPMKETVVRAIDDENKLPDDVIAIDSYRIEFGCGSRFEPTIEEITESESSQYPRSWFYQIGVNPENCKCFRAVGDSMEPTICNHDKVLVDCSVQNIVSGSVYAFVDNGELQIKRLHRLRNGDIEKRSDNPTYSPETIPRNDAQSFMLTGKQTTRKGGFFVA